MKNKLLALAKIHDIGNTKNPELTVVLIHGVASDAHTYDRAIDYLQDNLDLERIRLISFDLLGSGKSYKSDNLNYNYSEQLSALHQSIKDIKTPIILVGHSLGTFIVTRYAKKYPSAIIKLILISAPVYTEKDMDNPAFMMGIEAFKKAVSIKNPNYLHEKAFNNSMKNIVLKRDNYSVLTGITIPTTIIYGKEDQLIAPHNIPELAKINPYITICKTNGRHGITRDKYEILNKLLTEELNVKNL